jgi:GDPmannose 4,6-dehydratase
MPEYTASADAIGTVRLLEAIRSADLECRFYQASTSEMFGATPPPQGEHTAFYPRSPYGAAKLYAHWITVNYREAYNMFAVSGILFNHESPRRGETFVTRKITMAVARIAAGLQDELVLGNLDAVRDWGYAKEYVDGMWRMLQQDEPETFVLGTGVGTSVREFLQTSFEHVGLDWQKYVIHDDRYERPTEVDALIANPSKARDVLGWEAKTHATDLARLMVDADVEALVTER